LPSSWPAVVELEHRNIALGVDRVEVFAAGELVRLGVDLDQRRRQSGFEQSDMWRKRARARGVIEFHGDILFG